MTIQLSTKGAVATVTINRPEKLNALSHRMIDQLMDALDEVEADDAFLTRSRRAADRSPSGHAEPRP